MKYFKYITVAICLLFLSCEKNTEITLEEIESPSKQITQTVEFELIIQEKDGGLFKEKDLISDITIKIFEENEIKLTDVLGSDGRYSLHWDIKLGIKSYIEILAQTCVGDLSEESKFLENFQKILEITPDKNGKIINVYLTNQTETKNLTLIDPYKVQGRLLNENSEPVIAEVSLSSEIDATGSGAFSLRDNTYTDENGYFEMFINPGDVSILEIFGCHQMMNEFYVVANSDHNLGDFEICLPEYGASYLKAEINNCEGLPVNGYMKLDYYGNMGHHYLKVIDGKINIPEIFLETQQLEYEFFSPENASRSGVQQLQIDNSKSIIDLGNINLCETYESNYKLTINGMESQYKNIFIEKDASKLILNAPDHFHIQLTNFSSLQWLASSYTPQCEIYHTWIKEFNNSNSNSTISFKDFDLIDGELIEGFLEVEYYDEELSQTMQVRLDVSAPLTILN